MTTENYKIRTPWFPKYSVIRTLLSLLNGVPKADYREMDRSIWSQTGTPQDTIDWTQPDQWIDERLSGTSRELAHRIWNESKHKLNPRYMRGATIYIRTHELMTPDTAGVFHVTPLGESFMREEPETIRFLDDDEGLLRLLEIIGDHPEARRGEIIPDWGEYVREVSKSKTDNVVTSLLRFRLKNLIERGYVEQDGQRYSITESGQAYSEKNHPASQKKPKGDLHKSIGAFNREQRQVLYQRLEKMDAYLFEHLIRDLLEAMGYEDVEVTKQSGDKGIDVVGTLQMGVTTVKEVVQVKRQPNSSVGRPIIDQLRGSLHYFNAIRGTVVTLGSIAKGARESAVMPNVPPITLIDGEILLDLLIDHGIGIKKKSVDLLEIDEELFAAERTEELEGEV